MSINPKIIKLLNNLKEATIDGQLEWSESFSRTTFAVLVNNVTITISSDLEEGKTSYFVMLRDSKGKTIESEIFNGSENEGWLIAHDLHELARRSALHVDDVIDRVIEDIKAEKKRRIS